MKNLSIIGIDVSKLVLDVCILSKKYYFQVENSPAGFAQLLEISCKELAVTRDQLYFCFEHTGRYSRLLSVFLEQSGITFSQIPALDIRASKGISRGKTDKADAKDIALYACRKKNELKPTKLHSAETSELRQLIFLRDKLIKHRTAYKNSIKDLQDCYYEGKNNMSTLNIIRNKLLARIFAVVKRQTPYVDLYKFAA